MPACSSRSGHYRRSGACGKCTSSGRERGPASQRCIASFPPASVTVELRVAVESDRRALQALIAQDLAGTLYADVPAYFLRLALEGKAGEARAIVAERDGDVVGFVLVGEVAGSVGTGRVHFIATTPAARAAGVDASLCEAALRDLAAHGARLMVAEVADDAPFASFRALLGASTFSEVGRVDDYYRDG